MNDASSESLAEQVRAFVARELCVSLSKVLLRSSLLRDLGVDGTDGVDLLQTFAREFDVDLSSVRWDQHFGPEAAFNPLCLLLPSWWRRRFLPVTVADLVQFAGIHRWSYPYPDSCFSSQDAP